MISAGMYLRRSTVANDGLSIENQELRCNTCAAEMDPLITFDPRHIFVDRGISGATFDRPGWNALCRAIEAEEIKWLFVYAVDRLGRPENPGDMFSMRTLCIQHGVRVFSVSQGRELTSQTEEALWAFFIDAMQGRRERLDIIRRTWQGQKIAASKAGCHAYGGRPVYGHKSAGGVFVVDEERAPAVRQMFDLAAGGETCVDIAATLNAQGTPAPSGKTWHTNTVRRILLNPAAAGDGYEVGWTDVDTKEYHRAYFPAPALVEYSTWNAAQRQMALRKQVRSKAARNVYWLSSLGTCALCGRPLTGTGANGYRYYTCGARSRFKQLGLPKACEMPNIPAALLEDPIWDTMRRVLSEPAILSAALADGPDVADIDNALADIERQIGERAAAQARLALDFARAALPQDAVRAAAQALTVEIDDLNRQAAGLQMRRMALARRTERVGIANLDRLPLAARAELAHEMIARIDTELVDGGVNAIPYYWLISVDELNRAALSTHANALTVALPPIRIIAQPSTVV